MERLSGWFITHFPVDLNFGYLRILAVIISDYGDLLAMDLSWNHFLFLWLGIPI